LVVGGFRFLQFGPIELQRFWAIQHSANFCGAFHLRVDIALRGKAESFRDFQLHPEFAASDAFGPASDNKMHVRSVPKAAHLACRIDRLDNEAVVFQPCRFCNRSGDAWWHILRSVRQLSSGFRLITPIGMWHVVRIRHSTCRTTRRAISTAVQRDSRSSRLDRNRTLSWFTEKNGSRG